MDHSSSLFKRELIQQREDNQTGGASRSGEVLYHVFVSFTYTLFIGVHDAPTLSLQNLKSLIASVCWARMSSGLDNHGTECTVTVTFWALVCFWQSKCAIFVYLLKSRTISSCAFLYSSGPPFISLNLAHIYVLKTLRSLMVARKLSLWFDVVCIWSCSKCPLVVLTRWLVTSHQPLYHCLWMLGSVWLLEIFTEHTELYSVRMKFLPHGNIVQINLKALFKLSYFYF